MAVAAAILRGAFGCSRQVTQTLGAANPGSIDRLYL
jgi:hypothetical protein